MYGMSVDEAIAYFSSGEQDLSVVHPEDRQRYKQHQSDSEHQVKAMDIEIQVINPSGKLRYVHQRSDFVLDDEGRMIRSFGTEQDITERRHAEEDLKNSHALFKQSEQIAKLGHWVWDAVTDQVISCSDQYAKTWV